MGQECGKDMLNSGINGSNIMGISCCCVLTVVSNVYRNQLFAIRNDNYANNIRFSTILVHKALLTIK